MLNKPTDPGCTRAPLASDTQVGGGHYKDMAIEPSEFSQKNKLNWCEANVIKYVCRHDKKNGIEDLRKAMHYLELLMEWEYNAGLDDDKMLYPIKFRIAKPDNPETWTGLPDAD